MNVALSAILLRLSQPSTWAGGGIGFLVIHQAFPGALGDSIDLALAGLFGVVAIILNEKATPAAAPAAPKND